MHRFLSPLLITLCVGLSACGSSSNDRIKVSAAASLKPAFTALDTDARFSFAGSDQLAAQIRAGARPDVFAAANAKLPDALHAEGLVERPVAFARNRLVIAVPAGASSVRSVNDLAADGTTIGMGAKGVPIGDYSLNVIGKLPAKTAQRILANVHSSEPDVSGIVGKISEGAVDAGFVYASDVQASNGRLKAIRLPASLQPVVVYEAAVVKGAADLGAARAFVTALIHGKGATALRRAGLAPPP